MRNARDINSSFHRENGFTLVELLASLAIIVVLGGIVFVAWKKTYTTSSLAVSANNIRQLAAGGAAYLADNNYVFWPYAVKSPTNNDRIWWFGLEKAASLRKPEGEREFDASQGPLANYIPKGIRPDPSFSILGKAFKPKYRFGYIGVAYNTLVGGGYYMSKDMRNYHSLPSPNRVVVFATSAQINDFQKPASRRNPMLEEYYGLDEGAGAQSRYPNVHFRHNGKAMVAFATGNVGFLEMDESTRDKRNPSANIGRLAPNGSTEYLE